MNKYQEYLNIDVSNLYSLKKLGYNNSEYYCGNASCQSTYTWLRNKFLKLGIKFPFNPACFKHDLLYSLGLTVRQKIQVDYNFFRDMKKILKIKSKTSKKIKKHYLALYLRCHLYYFLVSLLTPVYMVKNGIKFIKNLSQNSEKVKKK